MTDDLWFQRQIAREAERRRRERISPLWFISAMVAVGCVLFALSGCDHTCESISGYTTRAYQQCRDDPRCTLQSHELATLNQRDKLCSKP
jgi:type VI protein secretion system component VasF